MQRKGNRSVRGNQEEKLVTVGVDMGGHLWATTLRYWNTGKEKYLPLKDGPNGLKQDQLCRLICDLISEEYRVHVFYEAGRYGFAPARSLEQLGAEVTILPVNKLEILVSGKKVKTDKIDSKFLAGLHPVDNLPKVYVPTVEEESLRGAERERTRLNKCVSCLNSQLISIIEKSDVPTPKGHMDSSCWEKAIKLWKKEGELSKLPPLDIPRMWNHVEEMRLCERHLSKWEKIVQARLKKQRAEAKAEKRHTLYDQLRQFRGIADIIARHFAWEIGDFKRFKNARHFTSYFGLTPTPWASGGMRREQGISKAGRKSLRRMAIEMAWLWYRWQPDCELVKKWTPKLRQRGRGRKTAITALARQVLVALWRHVVHDAEIKGAIINEPLEAI